MYKSEYQVFRDLSPGMRDTDKLQLCRGTLHAWKNVTTEFCRFLTVVIPSEKVTNDDTGKLLEVTKLPGLSD